MEQEDYLNLWWSQSTFWHLVAFKKNNKIRSFSLKAKTFLKVLVLRTQTLSVIRRLHQKKKKQSRKEDIEQAACWTGFRSSCKQHDANIWNATYFKGERHQAQKVQVNFIVKFRKMRTACRFTGNEGFH